MGAALPAVAVTVVMLAVAFLGLFLKFLFPSSLTSAAPDWLNEFSVDRYRPMQRLLAEEELQFLEAQPGYRLQMRKKFRAERRMLFRQYLRCLGQDFDQICGAIKLLTLTSAQDRPDLAAALLKQKCLFAYCMATVQARLTLHWLGIGAVDIRPLVDSIHALRLQFQQLAGTATASDLG